MNNKIIILLILIVFIFIIIDCNCKEGFSIGGPNYVLVEVETNRIIEDDEVFSGQNLVSASNIDGAKNIFETDHGIDFDEDEYQVKLQSEAVDVDASDTVPEPSSDFDFEDEEDDELADLYGLEDLQSLCLISMNEFIRGQCDDLRISSIHKAYLTDIMLHAEYFAQVSDNPDMDPAQRRLFAIIEQSINRTDGIITRLRTKVDTLKKKHSELDKDSEDYNLLNKIIQRFNDDIDALLSNKASLQISIGEI